MSFFSQRKVALIWAVAGVSGLALSLAEPTLSQGSVDSLTLPYSGSVATDRTAFSVTNTGTGNAIAGVARSGQGVLGRQTATGNYGYLGGAGAGVYGYSPSATGVYGKNNTTGNYGHLGSTLRGVTGFTSRNANTGVYGANTYTGNYGYFGGGTSSLTDLPGGWGAFGEGRSNGAGVYGLGGYFGLYGFADGTGGIGAGGIAADTGVAGVGTAAAGTGVYGEGGDTGLWGESGGAGVYGHSRDGIGVQGYSENGYAGYFDGDVEITGTMAAGAKYFKIDHPRDPENKTLTHVTVESDQMKNVYDGVAVLDQSGQAWVELPEWFQSLNGDFRYQLTCIGGFAPVYIGREIADNRFQIAGGRAGMKVSWQVTGVRRDAYAQAHPLAVEEEKPARQRGRYLHPEAFGQPKGAGIGAGRKQGLAGRHPGAALRNSRAPRKALPQGE